MVEYSPDQENLPDHPRTLKGVVPCFDPDLISQLIIVAAYNLCHKFVDGWLREAHVHV